MPSVNGLKATAATLLMASLGHTVRTTKEMDYFPDPEGDSSLATTKCNANRNGGACR
jgi:hypothetical protein